jgi:hypothetical protein
LYIISYGILKICQKKFPPNLNDSIDCRATFSLNDVPMDQCFEDVADNLYPVVHIQKKGVRVRARKAESNSF